MKRFFVLSALAVMLGFGSTAKAQDACLPFYVGASSGVSFLQDLKEDRETYHHDAGFAFSTFLGWNEGPGRLELEYSRFNNEIDTYDDGLVTVDGDRNNVDLYAYMMNGYLDFPISSRLTGYLGGGLGVAQVQVNDFVDSTSQFGIAYQTKVGASLSLTNRAELFGGYRFLGTEKLSTLHVSDQVYMHSLETGLRFKF